MLGALIGEIKNKSELSAAWWPERSWPLLCAVCFPGRSTWKGICLPAVLMPWQIPQDARTWRLVKAGWKKKRRFLTDNALSPHIQAFLSSLTNEQLRYFACFIRPMYLFQWFHVTPSKNILQEQHTHGASEGVLGFAGKFMRHLQMTPSQICRATTGGLLKADVWKMESLSAGIFVFPLTSLSPSSALDIGRALDEVGNCFGIKWPLPSHTDSPVLTPPVKYKQHTTNPSEVICCTLPRQSH